MVRAFNLFTRARKRPNRPRQANLTLEGSEPRALPAAGPVLQAAAHQLAIEGTQNGDQVQVNLSGRTLKVTFNGRVFSFNAAAVSQVLFHGHNGNDTFVNNTG